MARREPVVVTKNDRPVSIFYRSEDLEDPIWGDER